MVKVKSLKLEQGNQLLDVQTDRVKLNAPLCYYVGININKELLESEIILNS